MFRRTGRTRIAVIVAVILIVIIISIHGWGIDTTTEFGMFQQIQNHICHVRARQYIHRVIHQRCGHVIISTITRVGRSGRIIRIVLIRIQEHGE